MRILQILNSTCFGGIEAHVLSLAQALTSMGHPTFIACRRNPPPELIEAMAARKLKWFEGPMSGSADPASLLWLSILRHRLSAEIIHAHQTNDALRALFIARLSGTRALFTRHCCYPVRPRTARALSRCHRIIAVSEAVRQSLVAAGIPGDLVRVVYHGILDPGECTTKSPRVTCVVCARISDEKNQVLALDALKVLAETRPDLDVKIIIAGRAYGADCAYSEGLAAMASRPPIEGKVEFPGHIDDVPAILQRADIGLVTSRTEGLSYSLIEYMAAGLPVVSTPCEGPSEIIRDGTDGFIAGPDAESFARALATLVSSKEKRAAMGRAARKRFLETFTLRRMVDETLEVYRDSQLS